LGFESEEYAMAEMERDGVKIAYEFMGSGDVPLVFLNGIAMSISHWKPVAAALGSSYRCMCHDMRGQTLSSKPAGPYSLELHARDLATLMESTGIPSAHIIGTSYGAEVAMAFALEYPQRVRSLVLIDGVSELDPLLAAVGESWLAAAGDDPLIFYKTILPWNYSADFIEKNSAMLRAREKSFASLPRDWFDGFMEMCKAFLAIDMTSELKRITCPTLVLVGEKDILKPRKFSEIIARQIPEADLKIVPGAGHASVVEQPVAIAREITAFLESIRKG
jgi:3-oxoadipate enol-lactonase